MNFKPFDIILIVVYLILSVILVIWPKWVTVSLVVFVLVTVFYLLHVLRSTQIIIEHTEKRIHQNISKTIKEFSNTAHLLKIEKSLNYVEKKMQEFEQLKKGVFTLTEQLQVVQKDLSNVQKDIANVQRGIAIVENDIVKLYNKFSEGDRNLVQGISGVQELLSRRSATIEESLDNRVQGAESKLITELDTLKETLQKQGELSRQEYSPRIDSIHINTLLQRFNGKPIVIGGCGRSGTTLLLSMLSSHPKILAIPDETYIFCPSGYTENVKYDSPIRLKKLFDNYISKLDIQPLQDRWCEKTPKNVQFFGRILEYFSDISIINVVRDGRDVVLSKHPKNPEQNWVSIERWIDDVSSGLKYVNHPQVLTIRYEDLVLSYESTMRRICKHIGLDFNYHLHNWYQFSLIRQNVAWLGELQPLYSSSIGVWQDNRDNEIVQRFLKNDTAMNLLKDLGYD